MHSRYKHFTSVFGIWWGAVMGLWTALCSADTLVGKYASEHSKKIWEAAWLAPKWGWEIWGFGALFITVAFIFEISFREVRKSELRIIELQGEIYDGRPLFVIEINRQPQWNSSNPHIPVFNLRNCGQRPARFVSLGSIKSNRDRYTLHFHELPVLRPDDVLPISYWINERSKEVSDQRWLWEFLDDHPDDAGVLWWDIEVSFRDTDESTHKELVRVCFDVESKQLFVRAVPHTERNRKPLR